MLLYHVMVFALSLHVAQELPRGTYWQVHPMNNHVAHTRIRAESETAPVPFPCNAAFLPLDPLWTGHFTDVNREILE